MPRSDERPNLLRYSAAGLEFIITFGVMLIVGLLLDRHLGSRPAFTIAGSVAGFACGLYRLVTLGRRLQRLSGGRDDGRDAGPPGGSPPSQA
ncbi:MAG TPA: AtpZ/AtpI family protein [Phycisphaerae bacterium]|nr:AtpZ/AtpI family protein [Phycisphaerae bacterium]HUT61851.1 AtpZ/AtpI family protein [Phycisphaerae bacterium]